MRRGKGGEDSVRRRRRRRTRTNNRIEPGELESLAEGERRKTGRERTTDK